MTCPICLQDFTFCEEIIMMPCCKQEIHRKCTLYWYKTSQKCAVCNAWVTKHPKFFHSYFKTDIYDEYSYEEYSEYSDEDYSYETNDNIIDDFSKNIRVTSDVGVFNGVPEHIIFEILSNLDMHYLDFILTCKQFRNMSKTELGMDIFSKILYKYFAQNALSCLQIIHKNNNEALFRQFLTNYYHKIPQNDIQLFVAERTPHIQVYRDILINFNGDIHDHARKYYQSKYFNGACHDISQPAFQNKYNISHPNNLYMLTEEIDKLEKQLNNKYVKPYLRALCEICGVGSFVGYGASKDELTMIEDLKKI